MPYKNTLAKVIAEIDEMEPDERQGAGWAVQTVRDLVEKAAFLSERIVTEDDIMDVFDTMMENAVDHCGLNDAAMMKELYKAHLMITSFRLERAAMLRPDQSFLERLGREKACELLKDAS